MVFNKRSYWYNIPRGSKYPNSRVLGPKIHTLNGFWTLKPYYLGTWTLWDRDLKPSTPSRQPQELDRCLNTGTVTKPTIQQKLPSTQNPYI